MMGPNGFMGRTLLALQVLFRNVYFIEAFGDDASKKHQTVSRFRGNKLTASPVPVSYTHLTLPTKRIV